MAADWRQYLDHLVGHGTRERTARLLLVARLLVARLRVQLTRLESENPADPRLAEARWELHAATGAKRDAD